MHPCLTLLQWAQAVLKPLNRFRLLKAGRMCTAQVLMAEDAQPSHAADEAAQLAGVAARATAADTPQVCHTACTADRKARYAGDVHAVCWACQACSLLPISGGDGWSLAVQGGGASARAAAEVAGLLMGSALGLRMRPAPALAGPAPIFVPTAAWQPAQAREAAGSGQPGRQQGSGRQPSRGQQQQQQQQRQHKRPPRLQHDDPFELGLQNLAVV